MPFNLKTMNTSATKPKNIEARFIRNIERLRDDEIRLVMRDRLESQPIDCVNWSEFPYAPRVSFRIAHSDDALAIMFEVEEEHVRAVTLDSNGPVWEDSCVEFFVKGPQGEGYFNFEINCIGTALAAFRRSRTDADHFDEERMKQVRHFGSLPHAPINSQGEGQRWWMIEVIPFSLLGFERAPEYIEANLYKCGDGCNRAHFLSWSPIDLPEPNFHCPQFFGVVKMA
jgi:hypothetical protein